MCVNKKMKFATNSNIEVVGKNFRLMSLIIRHIDDIKERKNIELTCKDYYKWCHKKESNIPLSISETSNTESLRWRDDPGLIFEYKGNEIEINLPCHYGFTENSKYTLQRLFLKYLPTVESLNITKLYEKHLTFFKNIQCYENIKTLIITPLVIYNGGLQLFFTCPNLKPKTLIISDVEMPFHIYRNYFDFIKTENEMPYFIRNIELHCEVNSLKWLFKRIKMQKCGYFDELNLSRKMCENINHLNKYEFVQKILPYFKKVNYFIEDLLSVEKYQPIASAVGFLNLKLSLNIIFSKNINYGNSLSLCEIMPHNDIRNKILEINECRFLANPGITSNIYQLRIFDIFHVRSMHPFTINEIEVLKHDLLKMKYLRTLEMDYFLLRESSLFDESFFDIKFNLRNIKFYECRNMKYSDLVLIEQSCKKLENLCLLKLHDSEITIKSLTQIFGNLKGLYAEFCDNQEISNIFELYDNKHKWPRYNYLNIISQITKFQEYKINSIEQVLPRQPGQLTIKKYYLKNSLYCNIICQNNLNNHTKFNTLFCDRNSPLFF
uniref:F-box domain-containing protein n=1 Tax=Parastrongyloides trichosuri TaxID=131310 RepID=A0A0N4ZU14_PARTI